LLQPDFSGIRIAGPSYDAFLLISFGGPEGLADVIPFLENVLRGRNVPRERLLEVAEHYYRFSGVSPINQQCRELLEAIASQLTIPVYWGNRNWAPMLEDTVREMRDAGVKRVVALATSAFGSYSGCRQYREDIERARNAVEGAPEIVKIPPFWRHEGFLTAVADRLREAQAKLPGADVIYTAHSIPESMSQASPYARQLRDAAAIVNRAEPVMVYQSRSGPPSQPWLGPDICDYIRETESKRLIAVPLGFLSDHMEVLYDLDTEAAAIAKERGIEFVRAGTVGTHPAFVNAICELVNEPFQACAATCCPPARRAA
jgi:ferrochelatase